MSEFQRWKIFVVFCKYYYVEFFFSHGLTCPVNHLVLIGFIMTLKPLSAMELNPIKMTLTVSTGKKGEGCG